ncbi:putative major facilitator superfamily, MFS transporter superfamily [Helianthus annuus]|nr:putative major facilitator superfamily, MFS transporter superfamily [Helianthus annuus]
MFMSNIYFGFSSTTLPILSLFPFLYFMVRDFNIAEKEEDISYYVGFVGSAYMIGRALTSVFWGVVADRYGRKPVILLGTSTVFVTTATYNYLKPLCTPHLFCPNAYALELFQDEYQALGLSAISTSWGIGLIIGPALGGYLAQVFVHTCILIFYRYLPFIPCEDNILKID